MKGKQGRVYVATDYCAFYTNAGRINYAVRPAYLLHDRHGSLTQSKERPGSKMMSFYRGMTCENVTIKGDRGTPITAYVAKPSGAGPFPGVVLVHHLPGWSEFYIETTRRFAHHGYLAICANLYEREGGGSDGNPDDV